MRLSQTISGFKDPQETPDLCETPLLRAVLLQLILWLLPFHLQSEKRFW